MDKSYFVYIMASRPNGAVYIGVTSDLVKRVYEHREKLFKSHTEKYNINQLVHYEQFGDVELAIQREKRLKNWTRGMKNDLITRHNPTWQDLYESLTS